MEQSLEHGYQNGTQSELPWIGTPLASESADGASVDEAADEASETTEPATDSDHQGTVEEAAPDESPAASSEFEIEHQADGQPRDLAPASFLKRFRHWLTR